MRWRPSSGSVVAVVAAVGALGALGACGGDDDFELSGARREPEPNVGAITLPEWFDHDGAEVAMRAPSADGYLVLYWGYTSCPDICPTTMSDLGTALRELDAADAERVTVAMSTFDPAQDEADEIVSYVEQFVGEGYAFRTDDREQLDEAMAAFGVTATEAGYSGGVTHYDHTSTAFVIDADGDLVLEWPFGVEPDAIAADLEHLLAGDDR